LRANPAPRGDVGLGHPPGRPPLLRLDHAGLEQGHTVEEAGDLGPAPHRAAGRRKPGVDPPGHLGHRSGTDVAGGVRDHQVAPRRHPAHQPGDDAARVIGVRDQVQHNQEHDRDRLAQVQGGCGTLEYLADVAQIIIQIGSRAARRALVISAQACTKTTGSLST
jgi:hypothetical protein